MVRGTIDAYRLCFAVAAEQAKQSFIILRTDDRRPVHFRKTGKSLVFADKACLGLPIFCGSSILFREPRWYVESPYKSPVGGRRNSRRARTLLRR